MARIALDELRGTALRILRNNGYSEAEASAMLDVMLYAQTRGNNQGIVKLIGPGLPRDPNCNEPRIVRETPISARVDGGRSSGMYAVAYSMGVALEKARANGMALVGSFNTNSSSGAIGYYAGQIARAGFVSFVFAGSGEYVAPYGSYEARFGTNPLAIGIPAGDRPVVLDMATSAIARYGIVEAKTANRAIPADVAYDAEGQPTTDPGAALAGAIRTFGGHKGGGLSLMVELLTGALIGTERDAGGRKIDWGNLLLVLDPGLLTDGDSFLERVQRTLELVKGSKRMPGIDDILVPGERGDEQAESVLQSGMIELEDALWSALQTTAAK